MKSKVVYRINCLDCTKFYVDKTKRLLDMRVKEHKIKERSSVYKHMASENHRIDWDDLKIIDSSRDDRRLFEARNFSAFLLVNAKRLKNIGLTLVQFQIYFN